MPEKLNYKPYRKGSLRKALIALGSEVLINEGEAALSLRDLAHRIGVSHMAAYKYFSGKEALLAAISEEGADMRTDV